MQTHNYDKTYRSTYIYRHISYTVVELLNYLNNRTQKHDYHTKPSI